MISAKQLNDLVKKYETSDFIKDDPIQFPHRFKNKDDIEIAGFIASLFAYGNRKIFIKKLDELFAIMQNEPKNFVLNFDKKLIGEFNYRFAKSDDIISLFVCLNSLYKNGNTLYEVFRYGKELGCTVDGCIAKTVDTMYSSVKKSSSCCAGNGFYHMIPNPENKGAMKRMNMFLRWMVRKGPVDLGVWDFIKPSDLLIPLDVHVARVSRDMGLLNRNSNDLKAVIELTDNLKKFDESDPIKYDFAMFGYGIDSNSGD